MPKPLWAPLAARSARSGLVALAVYLGVSLLYFGVPILAHPEREVVGTGTDPYIFVWSLGWWPHAVLHGLNPIVTHAIWYPVGVNLAWTVSVPGLALLASPLTILFGPALSYNVLAVLSPALDAFAAYLLCRHLTKRFWPSLAGGYLFGFSSYVLGQTEGHLHMTAVFAVPLIALVVIRRLDGSLSRRRFVVALGVLLALQYSIGTEVFFTATLALAVSLAVAYALLASVRRVARSGIVELATAYALAGVLVSPLLVYAFLHFQHGSINQPGLFPGDLLNTVVPTRLTWLHTGWTLRAASHFQGGEVENGGYLGLPVVVIVAWFAWEGRHRATARLLVALAAIALLVELGDSLHFRGHDLFPLPLSHLSPLPLFNNVLPARISMFVVLAVSVIVALWAADSRVSWGVRIGLVAAGIVFLLPHIWLGVWHEHPERPAFFADKLYRACFAPDENVLMLPWPSKDEAMLWQAEAGYSFRMANGNLSSLPPGGVPERPFVESLISGYRPAAAAPLVRLARSQHTTTIAVDDSWDVWNTLFAGRQTKLGGIDLVNVRSGGRACSR